jgi:hypothetical protein
MRMKSPFALTDNVCTVNGTIYTSNLPLSGIRSDTDSPGANEVGVHIELSPDARMTLCSKLLPELTTLVYTLKPNTLLQFVSLDEHSTQVEILPITPT